MTKEKVEGLHKALQIFESIILIILGIVVCSFAYNEGLQGSISYCLAFILLIFGLFNIAFSYLFKKGISSLDTIFGSFLVALGILLIASPEIVNEYIPLFFGTLLITYGTIFLIETIVLIFKIKNNQNAALKFILFAFITIILIGGGVAIVYFRENIQEIILILVGVVLILLGILSLVHIITKIKKKQEEALVQTDPLAPTTKKTKKSKKEKVKEIELLDIGESADDSTTIDIG